MDENKRGRNLVVLSFAVILYILGGASFNEEGTLFGGSVVFTRTWVLEYASIILLGFYFYRFWLVTPLFKYVIGIKHDYLKKSNRLRIYVEKIGQIKADACIAKDEMLGGKKFSNEGVPWPERYAWNVQPTPLIYNLFKRRASVVGLDKNSSQIVTFEVSLSWWRCLPYDLWATLQGIFRQEQFWEDIFPMVLALIAFALVLANKFGLIQ